jgi:sugar/nucleoside kinase (ribokinase family)
MRVVDEQRARRFDVICAGEALWKLAATDGAFSRTSKGVRLRPGGGAVNVAVALAKEGLRVGLATVLVDDAFGRVSVEKIAASGVDVGGVRLAPRDAGLVLVDARGEADRARPEVEVGEPLEVPAGWSSQLLLLSGLSPIVSHAAALCKAARRARREGALVLIDFNASLHAWAGRDPRTIQMVLREVDAARCSLADLAVLGMDAATVRGALRKSAVFVVSDGTGGAVATGPFGEVAFVPPRATTLRPAAAGDAFTAALCAELTRPGKPGESPNARWSRALRRGHQVS